MSVLHRLAERAARRHVRHLDFGRLTVRDEEGESRYGPGDGPSANVTVHDPAFYSALVFGGHIGAAESYVRGDWDSDDLTSVIRLFARNRRALDGLETGWARLSQPALAPLRWLNRNTPRGSAKNVRAHYDLGNDFFSSWLDETLTYSAGYFADSDASLRDASIEKYDRICRKLNLRSTDRVIEIGTGWGGFAIHAASRYGCHVTTATISREQHRFARERVRELGLQDRIEVVLRDYRDLEGQFDKLVSIEMVEAVGHQFLDGWMEQCSRLLAPHGQAAVQAITVREDWYDPRQRQVDFIKKYIFPGSFIPAISTLASAVSNTDMRMVDLEDMTPHYAETLRRWRARFESEWPRIQALGFDECFRRLWRFYLCYCEGGFDEAILGSVQFVLSKPLARGTIDRAAARAALEAVA